MLSRKWLERHRHRRLPISELVVKRRIIRVSKKTETAYCANHHTHTHIQTYTYIAHL